MTNSNKMDSKRDHRRIYSTTDLAEQESQRCDVIDRFAAYEQTESEKDLIVPALAMRCYHLPGYSYYGDLFQYFRNNHPIFSIFCHHSLHPIRFRMRLLQLTGSIVFGLAVSNIIWLWFYYSGYDQGEPAVTVQVRGFGSGGNSQAQSIENSFQVTRGMVMLWTIGGLLHAVFDNTVWYISACVCCLSSRNLDSYRRWGTNLIVVTVLVFTAIATLALLLRTSAEASKGNGDNPLRINGAAVNKFLISYATELALALFVYYPLIATILFSGILGCGNIPILGGRPYEVKLEEKRRERMDRKSNSNFPAPF